MMSISLLLYSKPAFFVIGQFNMYLLQLFVILKNRAVHNKVQQCSIKNIKHRFDNLALDMSPLMSVLVIALP